MCKADLICWMWNWLSISDQVPGLVKTTGWFIARCPFKMNPCLQLLGQQGVCLFPWMAFSCVLSQLHYNPYISILTMYWWRNILAYWIHYCWQENTLDRCSIEIFSDPNNTDYPTTNLPTLTHLTQMWASLILTFGSVLCLNRLQNKLCTLPTNRR